MKEERKKFIKSFIETNKKRGVKISDSVVFLSQMLFIAEATVRADYYG